MPTRNIKSDQNGVFHMLGMFLNVTVKVYSGNRSCKLEKYSISHHIFILLLLLYQSSHYGDIDFNLELKKNVNAHLNGLILLLLSIILFQFFIKTLNEFLSRFNMKSNKKETQSPDQLNSIQFTHVNSFMRTPMNDFNEYKK